METVIQRIYEFYKENRHGKHAIIIGSNNSLKNTLERLNTIQGGTTSYTDITSIHYILYEREYEKLIK